MSALSAALLPSCCGDETRKAEPPAEQPGTAEPAETPATAASIEPEPLPPGTGEVAILERAYPAWGAVLDRAALLARRGQRGAVHGRVAVLAGGGGTWLMDETPGAPGLGIRIAGAGDARLEVKPGQRVLAFGAWEAADGHWVWKVERLVALSGGGEAPALSVAPVPGKLLASRPPPAEARVFWVLAAPVRAGDGWTIADAADGPPAATLLLPGEALGAPYGGLDYLAPEERWRLARGKAYAAPMSEVQLRRKLPLPVLRASAPPVAVPPR